MNNLLINAGFEDGDIFAECNSAETTSGKTKGWSFRLTKCAYIRSEANRMFQFGPSGIPDVKEGRNALFAGTRIGGDFTVCQEARITSGKPYHASAWVRAYDADGQGFGVSGRDYAGFRIEEHDRLGFIVSSHAGNYLMACNEKYALLEESFVTSELSASVMFILEAAISCNHWHGCVRFDNCSLTEDGECADEQPESM